MSDTEKKAGAKAKILPYRGPAKGGCPTCGRPAVPRYRPFCSKRCADIDLHRWLSEGYRIPTEEQPADESAESRSSEGPDEEEA